MRSAIPRPSFIEPLESRIAPATISIAPVIVDEGDTGESNLAHLIVSLDAAATSDVSFSYTLVNGTAVAGSQYSGTAGQPATVTIPTGMTTATIDVAIMGNNTVDNDSAFSVQLSGASSGSTISSTAGSANVTIWDDDRTVTFTQDSLNQTTAEGNSGIHNLSYSVHLSAPAQHPISVSYATSDGTGDATGTGYGGAISTGSAADYVGASGTFTFAAGTTQPADQSFSVGVKGDILPGPDESFNVNLTKTGSGPYGVKLATATTAATITNDDASTPENALTVSLGGNVTTSEGGNAQFTVKLSRLSESPVVVTYHTNDGTATAASDYNAQTGATKTIVSEMQDTISIGIKPVDSSVEGAETFSVTIDNGKVHNAPITLVSPNTSTATIVADPLPKLRVNDVTILENAGGTGETDAVFTVSLSYDDNHAFTTTQAGSFHYATMDGSATGTADGAGGDYKIITGDHNFVAGTTNANGTFTISVPITKDGTVESNENFTLKLTSNTGGVDFGSATATGTIVDANVQVSVPDITVAEGNDGTSSAVFALVLGKPVPAGYKLQVDYQTADSTDAHPALHVASGSSPQDYVPVTTGTVEFAAGATVGTVSIGIVGDHVLESNETFNLKVTAARLVPTTGTTSAVILSGDQLTGTGTIVNDDGPGVTASVAANAVTLPEGAANSTVTADFAVHLSSAYSSDVKVSYVVHEFRADGTTLDLAYTTNPANLPALVIPAYSQDGTIHVSFTHADTVGHDQVLTVTLTAVTPVTALAGSTFLPLASAKTAKTTILEDDAFVKIAGATKAEGASGTSVMPFAVQLVDANKNLVKLDHAVSIPFTTVDGTGVAGAISTGTAADFVAQAGTLNFLAGQNATTIGVKINGDTLGGSDENFTVKLNSATGASLYSGLSTATGVIVNDDGAAPVLTLVPGAPGVEGGAAATFTYRLSKASDSAVSFDYDTLILSAAQFAALQPNSPDGSDLAAQTDFTPRDSVSGGRITLPSGQLSGTFAVATVADDLNENAEHFGFHLKNITGAGNATGSIVTAVGTIAANDQPTLTVANASVVEGSSGTSDVTFTIKLGAATTVPVTFNVQTVPTGTATAGTDYVAVASHLVTIPVGETQVTQTVTVNGDNTAKEGDETFIFRVSEVKNAIPGSVDAVGTILSDEAVFTVAPTATAAENSEVVSVKVIRTGDPTLPADVTFTTIDGSAKSAAALPDFIGGTGTIHFAPNATEAFIKVALVNDNRHEATENFSVKLTGSTNGVLGASGSLTSTATITDDDAIPTATITSPAVIHETDAGTAPATFTITLDHANDESAVVFKVATADGTAHAGSDYNALTQTVTIPAGQLSATFSVAVLNDQIFDSAKTETFKANVTLDATGGVGKAKFANAATSISGTGSILDNETAPQLSIAAASFTEGSASNFVAQLNHASDLPVTVKYYTVDGTAKSVGTARDFTGRTSTSPGVLTIPAGSTSAPLNAITTVDDAFVEGNETFKLQLVSPVGATLNAAAASAVGTILDNDHAYLSINDVSLTEGNSGTQNAVFTVTLQGDTAAPFAVHYDTSSGTAATGIATPGTDYAAGSGSVTLGGPNGAHSAQILVKVNGDLVQESDEKFNVTLSGTTVATLVKAVGVGTILDDGDTQGTISINNATVVEGNGTTNTSLHYTATLSQNAPTGGVSFTVKTSELPKVANAARLNSDFLQPTMASDATKNLVVTIPAGSKTATFDVVVKADDTFETTEFLNVSLTNIIGAQPGNVVGTGTIYDNDLYFSQRVVKWTDVDGDIATLTTSKGSLGNAGFAFDTTGANIGAVGGRILNQLNLISAQAGGTFAHANISILATRQPDATGALTGDGLVNVGYVRTNTLDTSPTVLEMTGIDLGTLKIGGDLSRINAGDLFSNAAVTLLDVDSIGVKSAITDTAAVGTTATNVAVSQLIAGATTIKVAHDVSGVIEVTGGVDGRIGTLSIGGALRGTAVADSGRILITGGLGKATIHDIIGGAGAHSGSLTQFDTTAVLGSLTVTGDIVAGSGSQSGHVLFPTIGSVTVGGSMHGGFISGSNSLGTVTIGGDLDLAAKIYGGGLTNNHAIKSVVVKGKVNNGQILGGYIANINDTAANQVTKANADAQIDSVEIDGTVTKLDILAGTDPASSTTFARDDAALFSRIAKVVINGDVLTNTEAHYISAESIGTIIVEGVAKTATLAGSDLGTNSNFLLKFSL